jgi:DNA-binding NarL/FixJ family response regulator
MIDPRALRRVEGEPRLRVLLADDHPLVLEATLRLLAPSFDVVAAVSDGQQAVDAACQLDPDVAVLDVTMPGLNGFQTADALKRSGSRATIVMLTMHQSDELVAAAIDCGVQSYVMKSRMQPDLEHAIDHAVAGRIFVPSLASLVGLAPAPGPGRHAVLFGSGPRAFVDDLSDTLAAAIRRGDVVAIIATEATRDGIARRLLAGGCDLAGAADRGAYLSVDAMEAVSQIMVGGRLDATRVAAFVEDYERSRLAVSASNVTVVGEMAPLLCRDGHAEAALQLERTWDDLTRGLPFLTVCFYALEYFSEGRFPELFPGICAPHSAVCHATMRRRR